MNVEFRNSFIKDLKGLSDKSLLKRIKNLIEQIEQAESLRDVPNLKKTQSG